MQITLHAPQIVMLVLMSISLARAYAVHGKPFTHHIGNMIINQTILIALLVWGGFFG